MGNGNGEFDMPHSLATDFLFSYFYAAEVSYDYFVAITFVFTAMAFPVAGRSEDFFAEETISLWLVCTIVDSLRFGNFTIGAFFNRLW